MLFNKITKVSVFVGMSLGLFFSANNLQANFFGDMKTKAKEALFLEKSAACQATLLGEKGLGSAVFGIGGTHALSKATNANNVLSDVAALLSALSDELASSYDSFQYLVDNEKRDFCEKHTQGLEQSIKHYLDKLESCISTDVSAQSSTSFIAYFTPENLATLKASLESIKSFFINQMFMNQVQTNKIFQTFYDLYKI